MISNGQVKAYSGQGHLLGNIAAFLFVFIPLLGSIAAVGFWTLEAVWAPGLAFLILYTGAFLLAKGILGRSDTLDVQDIHGEGAPVAAQR